MSIFLERSLVSKLEDLNISGQYLNREDFVKHITYKSIWPRLNYLLRHRKERLFNKINNVLGDCIDGNTRYITYADDRSTLLVTEIGRNFISISGFFEEYYKRRKRSTSAVLTIIVAFIGGSAFWFILDKIIASLTLN